MAKKAKEKESIDDIDTIIETLNKTIDTLSTMQKNMEILNENMQGAIDDIEIMQPKLDKALNRLGLQ